MQMEMNLKIEPHFLAAFQACEASIAILDLLPESDLVEELKNIVYVQHDLFIHMIEGKHYGSNSLQDFLVLMQELKSDLKRMKDAP